MTEIALTEMTGIAFTRHASLSAFSVQGPELLVGGLPLSRVAARVGRTPFYAYSRQAIETRVARLRTELPRQLRLHYAMKANPMPAVVHCLARLTDGIDVASAAEMQVALDAGVSPTGISFAGPGKRAAEIRQAIAAGITLNLESESQYDQALAAANGLGIAPRLAIRVNPAFELKSSGMKMGGGPKPFGIDEARVPDLLRRMQADGVHPAGFHIFSGSQNLQAAAIVEAQTKSVALATALARDVSRPLEWVNIGGGFGVPYFPGEKPLELGPICTHLDGLCRQAESALGAPLVIELGRYLVAEAGIYVSSVIDRKESQGQTFVVVDGGLHHNLAASGNFGQVIRKNYPTAIGNQMTGQDMQVQTVVGPLCTPLDLLADRVELPVARIGDLFVVFMAGAYGLTASPLAFLSHPAPAEVLI